MEETLCRAETNLLLPCVVRCSFWCVWVRFWLILTVIVVVYCKLCVYRLLIDCFNSRYGVNVGTRGTWWSLHPPCSTCRKWGDGKGGKICCEVGMHLNRCVNTTEINCLLIIEVQAVSETFNLCKRPRLLCDCIWRYSGFECQAGDELSWRKFIKTH
jgi:hypothetical protein